ncbi:caffeoyl-coa o-methyltransferase [Ilyonectria robusta]
MKENETPLYATPELSRKVTEYSAQHSTPLPKYITDFHASIAANRDDSYFMSSNFQSQWNYVLARSIGAKRGEQMSASVTPYARMLTTECYSLGNRRLCWLLRHGLVSCCRAGRTRHGPRVRAQVCQDSQRRLRRQPHHERRDRRGPRCRDVSAGSTPPLQDSNTLQTVQAQPERALRHRLHRRRQDGIPWVSEAAAGGVSAREHTSPAAPRCTRRLRQRAA